MSRSFRYGRNVSVTVGGKESLPSWLACWNVSRVDTFTSVSLGPLVAARDAPPAQGSQPREVLACDRVERVYLQRLLVVLPRLPVAAELRHRLAQPVVGVHVRREHTSDRLVEVGRLAPPALEGQPDRRF